MKVEELRAEVDRRLELGHDWITLVVPGARHGRRARVIPGVLAEVLGHNCDGNTIVSAPLDKLDEVLEAAGYPRNKPPAESVRPT